MSLQKVLIPVAGLGTRFLPATKAQPKEMLPVLDRPLIQYAVEEAAASGFEEVVLVTAPGKEAIESHFEPDPDLCQALERSGKEELLELVRQIDDLDVTFSSVEQREPRGVGHAVLMGKEAIGDEPFGVMFPDDLILSDVPVLQQLRRVHDETGGLVLAVQRVPRQDIGRYGVVSGEAIDDRLYSVDGLVEKPSPSEAPSDLAIVGRYVLLPSIFALIESTEPGAGGEIQLTDAIRAAIEDVPCHALVFEGRRYDCGNKLGFLEATVAVAVDHPELGPPFRDFLRELQGRWGG